MTKDTERALELIVPLAEELGIDVDADAFCLYCNGQPIGISCNSTYATLKEFLGYALYSVSKKDYRYKLSPNFITQIKRYWYNEENYAEMEKFYNKEKTE